MTVVPHVGVLFFVCFFKLSILCNVFMQFEEEELEEGDEEVSKTHSQALK